MTESQAKIKINRRIQQVLPSSTLAITSRAKELKAQGVDVVNFAAGEPDFDTPDPIKQAAIQAIEKGETKYTPSTGTLELRKAIAQKFLKDNGLTYSPNQIAVSCGAKHSLFNIILTLVDEGDDVLVPSPFWVSYPEMVKVAGGTTRLLETTADTGFKITAQQLAKAITPRTRALILNSPSNPTGVVYGRAELQAIADVCVQKQIAVISDEIYEKLIYDTDEYVSIASLGKEIFDLTVTVNGMSKAYAMTGWRIGYAAGPQAVMDAMKNFQDHSTSNPCSISQAAALQALQSPEDSINAMRDEFRTRRDLMMAQMDTVPGLSYIRPEGAFYLFCDVSKFGKAFSVAKSILDEISVAVIPGDGFGADNFIRLSFATSQARIKEGTRRLAAWAQQKLQQPCPRA